MKINFEAGQYLNQETGRRVWAVFCKSTHVWLFPKSKGEKPAIRLAHRLNCEID